MHTTSQIKKGGIISYGAIFLNIVAGLLYTPWMIRQIGVSDYGLYALVGAFLSYFIMDFGLGSAIARFIANARARNDEKEVSQLIATSTVIYFIIDLVIALTLVTVFFFLSGIFSDFTPNEIEKFKIIYCIAGFFSIISFPFMAQNGILIAYERFVMLKSCDMAQKMGVIVLMVIALMAGYGLYALVLVNGLVGIVIALVKFSYITRKTNIKIHLSGFSRKIAVSIFKFSVWIFIIGIAQRLMLNIAPTIIGIFSETTQIAVFSIGMTLEAYTWTFANALNGLFLPRVAKLSLVNQTRTQINDLMIRVGRIQLLVVGLLITGIVVLGKPFITLWIGSEFSASYFVALCLIVPGIVSLTQEIANSLLYVENEVRYRAIFYIAASVLSVIVGSFLTPIMGAVGAAIGVVAGLIVCHVICMNIVYAKVLKLDIGAFFRKCHLKMLPPILLSGCISLTLQHFYPVISWPSFIGQGAVFGLSFCVLMWIISMNSYEKSLIKELLLPTMNKR